MQETRLVLHVCCAPDEAWVVKKLHETHELRCFFCNPNIQPLPEYEKRLAEAQRVAAHFGVPFSAPAYQPEGWEAAVQSQLDTPEGGARCMSCFLLRLRATAQFCRDLGWPAFTTVMSISPHKRIAMLNTAGATAAAEHGVAYEPYDFKKNDGFLGSIKLSKELGLYRQDYCGCRLSRDERDARASLSRRHTASAADRAVEGRQPVV
jgi:epoxyqueuosine reductase